MTQLIPATAFLEGSFTPAQGQSVIFDGAAILSKSTQAEGNPDQLTVNVNFYLSSFGTTRYVLGCTNGSNTFNIFFDTLDRINIGGGAANAAGNLISTQVFRDVGWYNLHMVYDSAQGTSSNRLKVEINGVPITVWTTETYPTLNNDNAILNSGGTVYIGANNTGTASFTGAMSDFQLIPGVVSSSTFLQDFPFNGGTIKATKSPSGISYGTGGFRLQFQDSANFGDDTSGNVNDLTPSGFVTSDQVTSVPGDPYAIMDPLIQAQATPITDGGRGWGNTANTEVKASSIVVPSGSGRYYCEMEYTSGSVGNVGIGVYQTSYNFGAAAIFGVGSVVYLAAAGNKVVDGSTTAYGSSWIITARIGILLDTDADTVEFYNEGVAQGAIALAAGQDWHFGAGQNAAPGRAYYASSEWETTPTDVKELKASNLPTPEFNGQDYFGVNTRTGTGAAFSVTNGPDTDFVWSKSRSAATSHVLSDSVRGAGLYLSSNATGVEVTDAQSTTSFDTAGYSGGTATILNNSGQTYVDWMWKAGGAGVANTDGTITSTVSVASSGHFSISTATTTAADDTFGTGISHDLVITKERDVATSWYVWAQPVSDRAGTTQRYLQLASTSAQSALDGTAFRSMDNGLVTAGSNGGMIGNLITYAFASTPGLCKVGSYTGNGSANGRFVPCGFKPRWVLLKNATVPSQWSIIDTARSKSNVANARLLANDSPAEVTLDMIDVLSGGFKLRNSSAEFCSSGHTFIYLALAEEAGGGTLPFPLGR